MDNLSPFLTGCVAAIESTTDTGPAMEGIVTKFRNRKVRITRHVERWYPIQYPSLNKFFEAVENDQWPTTDDKGHKIKVARIEDLPFSICMSKEEILSHKKFFAGIIKMIRVVQKDMVQTILDEYNESEGKNGPWDWTEGKEFSKKSASDVNIELEAIDCDYFDTKDICSVEFFFGDGNLYWGHVLVTDGHLFDNNGRYVGKPPIKFAVEG